jgi:hypothetical protein
MKTAVDLLEIAIREEIEIQKGKLNPKKLALSLQEISTICASNGQKAEKYQLRMLQTYLGIYVYEFEERFGVKINEE